MKISIKLCIKFSSLVKHKDLFVMFYSSNNYAVRMTEQLWCIKLRRPVLIYLWFSQQVQIVTLTCSKLFLVYEMPHMSQLTTLSRLQTVRCFYKSSLNFAINGDFPLGRQVDCPTTIFSHWAYWSLPKRYMEWLLKY